VSLTTEAVDLVPAFDMVRVLICSGVVGFGRDGFAGVVLVLRLDLRSAAVSGGVAGVSVSVRSASAHWGEGEKMMKKAEMIIPICAGVSVLVTVDEPTSRLRFILLV